MNSGAFGESEGVSVAADLEISSTIETGASSADDDENVPFAFDMSNRVSFSMLLLNSSEFGNLNSENITGPLFSGQITVWHSQHKTSFRAS